MDLLLLRETNLWGPDPGICCPGCIFCAVHHFLWCFCASVAFIVNSFGALLVSCLVWRTLLCYVCWVCAFAHNKKGILKSTLLFATRVTEIELPSSRSLIEERQSREQCWAALQAVGCRCAAGICPGPSTLGGSRQLSAVLSAGVGIEKQQHSSWECQWRKRCVRSCGQEHLWPRVLCWVRFCEKWLRWGFRHPSSSSRFSTSSYCSRAMCSGPIQTLLRAEHINGHWTKRAVAGWGSPHVAGCVSSSLGCQGGSAGSAPRPGLRCLPCFSGWGCRLIAGDWWVGCPSCGWGCLISGAGDGGFTERWFSH